MKSKKVIQLNAINQTIKLISRCLEEFEEFEVSDSFVEVLELSTVKSHLRYASLKIKQIVESLEE
jgi:hypothetical protein